MKVQCISRERACESVKIVVRVHNNVLRLVCIILVPPLFIEGNSHSYNRSIFVFARVTVPY